MGLKKWLTGQDEENPLREEEIRRRKEREQREVERRLHLLQAEVDVIRREQRGY